MDLIREQPFVSVEDRVAARTRLAFLEHAGETGRRMRSFVCRQTPLRSPCAWRQRLAAAQRPDDDLPRPPTPDGAEQRKRAPVARILVADDNRDAASSLATLLTLDGHDVRVANDG